MSPRPVAGIDAGFLMMESATTMWHVGGVLVLDPSTVPDGAYTVDGVRALVRHRLDSMDAFRKVVVPGPLGLWPHWEDGHVDVERQVSLVDIGDEPTVDDVIAYAGRFYETPLDRSRPLWEIHVVERLAGGGAAMIAKVHHSLADGIAAVALLAALLDLAPRPPGPAEFDLGLAPAPPEDDLVHPLPLMELPIRAVGALAGTVNAAVRTVRHLADVGWSISLPFAGPRTSGHDALTRRRQVSVGSFDVETVKAVRARMRDESSEPVIDATFNDVVMAVLTGAARRWLEDAGQMPDRSLLAVVPASTRGTGGSGKARNQVSALFVSLPVHLADPVEQLRAITHDSLRAKRFHDELGAGTLESLADLAPWQFVGALWRGAWNAGILKALPPVANLLVTSVPGPPLPVYFAGAHVTGMYPLGPIFDGVPLNVTAVSHGGSVEVGVLSCPDLLPDVGDLAARFPAALQALADAVR